MVEDEPIAYIDRVYDDDPDSDAPQPWHRRRRWFSDEGEWQAACDRGARDTFEEADFDSADEAIAWARERADIVVVRLGSTEDTFYSAGVRRANQRLDESGGDYLEWPPDNWPEYRGPDAETRKFENRRD
jgi:hypothetical protein